MYYNLNLSSLLRFASWMHDIKAINYSTFGEFRDDMKESPERQKELAKKNYEFDVHSYADSSGWILKNVSFMRREKYASFV